MSLSFWLNIFKLYDDYHNYNWNCELSKIYKSYAVDCTTTLVREKNISNYGLRARCKRSQRYIITLKIFLSKIFFFKYISYNFFIAKIQLMFSVTLKLKFEKKLKHVIPKIFGSAFMCAITWMCFSVLENTYHKFEIYYFFVTSTSLKIWCSWFFA